MENRKYLVNRDNIHVGEVIQTSTIYRYNGYDNFLGTDYNKIGVASAYGLRSMLFVPNNDLFADDLLYASPNYPILNMTDDDVCLNLEVDAVFLRQPLCLAPLLQYFGYAEQLGYDDVLKIRKQFFDGSFAKKNAELFGFKPVMAEDLVFYKYGEVIEDSKRLEKARRQYERDHRGDNRRFRAVKDGPLPREFFEKLDDFGDLSLVQALLWHEKRDVFIPSNKDGKIKKLSKF